MLTKRSAFSGYENELSQIIVKLDCEHAQSDGKSLIRGLPELPVFFPEAAIFGADQRVEFLMFFLKASEAYKY